MANFDSPLAYLVAFLALVFTSFMIIVRITQGFFFGGILGGGVIGLISGLAWYESFFKK